MSGAETAGPSIWDWLTVAALAVAAVGLILAMRRLDAGRPLKVFLWTADFGLLILGIIAAGLLGGAVVGGTSLLTFLVCTADSALKIEKALAYAATQAKTSTKDMRKLHRKLLRSPETHDSFASLGYMGTAQLLSEIAQRNRSIDEIENMARPIAIVWAVHRPDLADFVDKFDRLMRLNAEPSTEAMRVADVITAGVRDSAGKFEEMLDAYIAVSEVAGYGRDDSPAK